MMRGCSDINSVFEIQKDAFSLCAYPKLDSRISALNKLKNTLKNDADRICNAINEDYGHRSKDDTMFAEIIPCIQQINHAKKHLKYWMSVSRRKPGLLLFPSSVNVHYQPLGVVGIMAPWNFPIMLSIGPLIAALSAGNRAMIKLPEFTPKTNVVIRELLSKCFNNSEVAVVEGGADVAAKFSSLPFDHLLFTGSTFVGRKVMTAASQNLTPVTLELGGKSPCIIAPDMDINIAVERIVYGKCLNAGQICVAPDYILLPRGLEAELLDAFRLAFQSRYPNALENNDYSSVVNKDNFERLIKWRDEAIAKGASVASVAEPAVDVDRHRMVPHLIWNVPEQCSVIEQEIFGPLLPIVSYDSIDDAFDYIKRRPRPLACYLMSFDRKLNSRAIEELHAGGMAINETVLQVGADDAPFGGVGPSGMGHYHGHEGFLTFSKAKTVLKRGRLFNTGLLIHPPYGTFFQKLIIRLLMR